MRKLFALALALCLVFALGGCSIGFGGINIGLRTVRGNRNVVEQVFHFTPPAFEPPEEGEVWDMFSLTVLNINFSLRGNTRTRIVVDETLGNTIVIATDENLMQEFAATPMPDGGGLTITGWQGRRLAPSEFTITTGVPITHLQVEGAWNISYNHTGTPYAQITINGAVNGDFNFGTLDSLNVQVNGAGDIDLRGETPSVLLEVNGASSIHAFDLIAETAEVTVNGAGSAELTATERLDATINGVGNITFDGSPTVNRQINGIGRIQAR